MQHFFVGMRGGLLAALLGLLMLAAGPTAQAQAPAWQTAAALITGTNVVGTTPQVTATTADASGNIYLTGSFAGVTAFGSVTLTSRGPEDAFVAKWNPRTGGFSWVQQAGGTGRVVAQAIAVSGTSVYISGDYEETLYLNNIQLPNASRPRNTDGFVAKLTDTGPTASFSWAQAISGADLEGGMALAVSGPNVYVAGYMGYQASFGSISLGLTGQYSQYITSYFVCKLFDAGSTSSFVWAQRFAGQSNPAAALGLAANGATLYVGGSFSGSAADFGSTVLSTAAKDGFVAQLSDLGSTSLFNWVRPISSTGSNTTRVAGLAAPATGGVYIAGNFFGPTATLDNRVLSNTAGSAFVARLSDAGTVGWVAQAEGIISGLASRGPNLYISGTFAALTARFGSTTLTKLNTSQPSSQDVFLAKLVDAGGSGSFVWAQQGTVLNTAYPYVNGPVVVATSGPDIYAMSAFPALGGTFGPLAYSTASAHVFLARLTDAALLPTALPEPAGLAFALFPNPARGTATVQLPPLPGAATATLVLCDALGRAVRTATVALPAAGLRHEYSLAGLAPGLYALHVRAGAATATRRLVLE